MDKFVEKDGKLFRKTGKIQGKRPARFWLVFIKENLLTDQKKVYSPILLIFLIPITLAVLTIISLFYSNTFEDFENLMPAIMISAFACFFIYAVLSTTMKKNFIHSPSFHHLARFIVHIKGDIYKQLISLRIDNSIIEADANYISPKTLGVNPSKGTVYKPYQIERYALKFQFNDGTKGLASLHQISVRVRSTKRRSSGKTKTKVKFKHKLFYQLILTLPKSLYKVTNASVLATKQEPYGIVISEDSENFFVKIKMKQKRSEMFKKISHTVEDDVSYYTKMLKYAIENRVFEPLESNTKSLDNKIRF